MVAYMACFLADQINFHQALSQVFFLFSQACFQIVQIHFFELFLHDLQATLQATIQGLQASEQKW